MPRLQDDKTHGVEKPPADPPARSGVVGAMMVAVLLGAVLGAAAGAIFLPDLMIACVIGGALTLAAARVAILMSSDTRGLAPLDKKDGTGQ